MHAASDFHVLILPYKLLSSSAGFGNNSADYEAPFGEEHGSLAANLRVCGCVLFVCHFCVTFVWHVLC